MNRKDFFIQGIRLTILSVIGLLSTFLIVENKVVSPDNCSVSTLCKNCGKYSQCDLPQAIKEKKHE
jgi:hypothetical protein